jgi:hypothetical protein
MGLKIGQTIILVGSKTSSIYPDSLRKIFYFDSENQKTSEWDELVLG